MLSQFKYRFNDQEIGIRGRLGPESLGEIDHDGLPLHMPAERMSVGNFKRATFKFSLHSMSDKKETIKLLTKMYGKPRKQIHFACYSDGKTDDGGILFRYNNRMQPIFGTVVDSKIEFFLFDLDGDGLVDTFVCRNDLKVQLESTWNIVSGYHGSMIPISRLEYGLVIIPHDMDLDNDDNIFQHPLTNNYFRITTDKAIIVVSAIIIRASSVNYLHFYEHKLRKPQYLLRFLSVPPHCASPQYADSVMRSLLEESLDRSAMKSRDDHFKEQAKIEANLRLQIEMKLKREAKIEDDMLEARMKETKRHGQLTEQRRKQEEKKRDDVAARELELQAQVHNVTPKKTSSPKVSNGYDEESKQREKQHKADLKKKEDMRIAQLEEKIQYLKIADLYTHG